MSIRGRSKATGIQMFPFLDALICTMGALLVLLHAFASHDQTQVKKAVAARQEAQRIEEQDEIELQEWRAGHLTEARKKTQAKLAEERLRLAHIEDHQRRLEEQLRKLQVAAQELERAGSETTAEKQQNAAALEETKGKLAAARAAVDEARQKGKHQDVSYSIIPFEGRNSTQRRPIYIECRENLIILQPEGIELTPRDFIGFFGPGNPLASALRAQSEYFSRQAPPGQTPEEPYPLLLVRPDGVSAYYAARAALDSWGNEFGYELVGADWDLKFPERDRLLGELTQRVVSEARERHREYILSSPQVARRRPKPVYHAKSQGGFEKDQGTGDGPDGSGLGEWGDHAHGWGDNGGSGMEAAGSSREYAGQNGAARDGGADGLAEYDSFGAGSDGTPAGEPGEIGPRQRSTYSDNAANRNSGGSPDGGTPRESSDYVQQGPYKPNRASTSGNGGPGTRANPDRRTSGPGGEANGEAQSSGPVDPESLAGTPDGPVGSGNGSRGKESAVKSPLSSGNSDAPAHGSAPQSTLHSAAPTSLPRSLAATRGSEWGLSGSSVGAVAASRPILVQCYLNRLVLVPESRNQLAKEIRLGEYTQDSMDDFVSSVWDYMKVWGKAGRGLYWRPTLVIDVAPGGEHRFAEIQSLMAGSGLDVSRRNVPTTAQQPAVQPPLAPASRR